ncbi:ATP-dependent helicase [Clostridium tyrobutyricum]|uniref:ATP-dependent helicase n=1 Tax=Clostridium tyrobutyricum TaxID=1519 RepID=UPI001C381D85|nr:ATP-dependent helicase [Clostridium tyrobutyricum]MBV4432778.1 ATP-dependent helicase [Clostridium tyrobutyricum]MBV4437227.1 ATP-dependent helicase [Clostridium tyrobutyricum]
MIDDYAFLNDLNETQKQVCISEDNFVITSCPGSGKTRTITYRLAYLAKKYKKSRKLNIAITYTNRAADEIENRLIDMGIDISNIWTGTIHQFCMNFIIRRYAMYHKKLSKGYRIIDEFVRDEYLKAIADEIGIRYCYVKELYKNQKVMNAYLLKMESNREIDFDMILEYSKELLEKNIFTAENIAYIIRSIHVDEYQDTNERQYDILAAIVKINRDINLLFVGDINQAIYGNLGGIAKSADEIRKLFPIAFTEKCLDGCYRSTQRLVDYYTNYEVVSTGVTSVSTIKDNKGIIKFNFHTLKDRLADVIAGILQEQLDNDISENEICIVAPQWYQIYPMANKLRKLMPNNNFDAPDISPIKYDPLNVFYLIAKLLFTKNSNHRLIRRKIAVEIINMLKEDYEFRIPARIDKLDILRTINSTPFIKDDAILTLKKAISNVCHLLVINITGKLKNTYDDFFYKIQYRVRKHKLEYNCLSMEKCFKERKGIVINTIHGVKGEEYTTVIGFDLLTGHLPNWGYIWNCSLKPIRHEETNKLLYVLCSRAKKNLYLISERGRKTQKNRPYETTEELAKCDFEYD